MYEILVTASKHSDMPQTVFEDTVSGAISALIDGMRMEQAAHGVPLPNLHQTADDAARSLRHSDIFEMSIGSLVGRIEHFA